jgi:hypothetical protein
MATNRDLLKEAIADAKAVKETAIANAKAALTESFTPFLREKLSEKIQAMDEEDDAETEYDNAEAEVNDLDEISLDELLAELEEMEAPEMEEENLYEAKEEEEDEEMSIEDMDEDDLKSFIEDVIKDMVANKELEAGHEGMENEEGAEEMEAPEGEEEMESEEEEVDLEELLAEIEEGESEELEEVESLNEFTFDISTADAIISMLAPVGVITGAALLNFRKEIKDWFKNNAGKKISDAELTKMIKAKEAEVKTGKIEENTQIAELKSELNEINLLNAKLLYTNKIFRSKSLTESQKIKVLTAFDKAKTKKEAQLVYETLLESLKVSNVGAKTSIKESLGSASKSLGNAKAKPIIEVDNQFARWQTLAGIKK